MKSMTGYGRGECARTASNHRGTQRGEPAADGNFREPAARTGMLEAPIRDAINARIARGRVTARITIHAANGKLSARSHINLRSPKLTQPNWRGWRSS